MRRFLLLACLMAAAPVQAEELVSGVSQDLIQITSNYTGSDIVVFGAVEGQNQNQGGNHGPKDVVVVVRGHDAADLSGMPSYYFLASTRPLSAIAPAAVLARYGIGVQSLRPDTVHSHHDYEPFRQAALRHLSQDHLYSEVPGGVEFLSDTLFRAHVPVPAGVMRGQYNVEVFLFRGSAVISAQSTPLFIDQTGLERRLYNFAHNQGFDYGLATVLMAIAMGWISSLLFRRPV
jgi:hypothetical protein